MKTFLVVGGGIGGVQAALDLAEAGARVYLVERAPAIGGYMAMLDKTFPTNDCSICILSPKLVTCARHPNVILLTLAEPIEISGSPGAFYVKIKQYARSVDLSRCTGCGDCMEKCPVKLPNEFEGGLSQRRAIYRLYAQAVPNAPTIDRNHCLKFTKDRCGNCARVCKTGAIDYSQKDEEILLEVAGVILAPGAEVVSGAVRPEFGYRRFANVVTSLEFERILSASGPFSGQIQRPADGKEPKKIAWVQCFGSRDETLKRNYCSSVCCMYAVKEAVIAREHNKEIEPTIFYMDIRAQGKEFERYIERAEKEFGVRFVRARVTEIREEETKDLTLCFKDEKGRFSERFDLVVLSCGLTQPPGNQELLSRINFPLNRYGFPVNSLKERVLKKCGIFLAGSGESPKDIPETVMQASAAAGRALSLFPTEAPQTPATLESLTADKGFIDVSGLPPRIGVFVCHCGINIGGVIRIPEVVNFARTLPGVVYAEENLYSCSADSLRRIGEKIKEQNLTRVVVASCSPRTHEGLFQQTLAEAGLNPHLFAMANIRDQCSWVHREEPDRATEKAKDLVKMAVARVRRQEPLTPVHLPVKKAGLVIGGGIAGMTAALTMADAGFDVFLVEEEKELGGNARAIHKTIEGEDVAVFLNQLIEKTVSHPRVKSFTNAKIKDIKGFVGSFTTTIEIKETEEQITLEHGVVILAIGARYREPVGEYGFGQSDRIITQKQLEETLNKTGLRLNASGVIVMIQCVGSREEPRQYCSRICCTQAVKNALRLKELNPALEIYILYRDLRTYGFMEDYYRRARENGIHFIRYTLDHKPKIVLNSGTRNQELSVKVYEPILDIELELNPDLLVLSSGIVAHPHAGDLAKMLKVPINQDGFFLEAHAKLRPVEFATEGVFLCGLCHYPKFIPEAIANAQAAAGRALTILSRDFISAEPYQAVVTPQRCSACHMCETICPYRAIEVQLIDERTKKFASVVNPALCKGCGACVANCRSGAIDLKGFRTESVFREISALLSFIAR